MSRERGQLLGYARAKKAVLFIDIDVNRRAAT